MPNLPEGYSIVSDREFEVLALSPTFKERGECLYRTDGDKEFFVLRQSFYDRWQRIEREVDQEELLVDAHREFNELLAAPVTPSVEEPTQPPVPPADPIVDPLAGDRAAASKYGIGVPLPDRPPSSRPRDQRGGFIQF